MDSQETPIGTAVLLVEPENRTLVALDWTEHIDRTRAQIETHTGKTELVPHSSESIGERLRDYFAGSIDALEDIPVTFFGTPFQCRVWEALRRVPPGQTTSYGTLAVTIGRPGAARAVGLANGHNPISVVVPCHRVIGANGTLTGYGGGLPRKRWLLDHEARTLLPLGRNYSFASGSTPRST